MGNLLSSGGGSPVDNAYGGGGSGGGGMDFSNLFDPTSWMGSYADPLSAAQQQIINPPDPTTGASQSPGVGQQSGQQSSSSNPLSQLANMFMSTSGASPGVGNIQSTAPEPQRSPGEPSAPAWMQPNPAQMFTQSGDPSTSGSPSYAGMVPGNTPQPPQRQQARPAPQASVPLPQSRPAAADGQYPGTQDTQAIDPSTLSDVSLQGAAPATPAASGYTYDPSQDPFGAGQSTANAVPAALSLPEGPPANFGDYLPWPSQPADTAVAAPVPPVGNTPSIWQGGTAPVPQQDITGSGAPQPASLPPSAPQDTAAPSPQSTASGAPVGTQPAPAEAPSTAPPAGAQAGAGGAQGGQQDRGGGMPFNPLRMLADLLFGGPQALMQDLGSLAQQQMGGINQQGGYGGQQGGYGGQGRQTAPWLAQGQRAPRGTNPYNYPQATPEQIRDIRAGRAPSGVPSATKKPQSPQISGDKPKVVSPQRVTSAVGGPELPSTGGATALDPFTTAQAGRQGLTGGTPTSTSESSGLSNAGFQSLRQSEGFEPRAKWDYQQWTNGYGTKARYPGEVIDRPEAERRLQQEAGKAYDSINSRFPNAPQNVKDALTSFTYNLGPGWMERNPQLVQAIQDGNYAQAARMMQAYNHAGGAVNPGLINRRRREGQMMIAQAA